MIDFVYVAMVVFYAFLFFAFYLKEYIFSLLAAIGILMTGVYLAINGAGDLNNFLTSAVGMINICVGAYVFIVGSIEQM